MKPRHYHICLPRNRCSSSLPRYPAFKTPCHQRNHQNPHYETRPRLRPRPRMGPLDFCSRCYKTSLDPSYQSRLPSPRHRRSRPSPRYRNLGSPRLNCHHHASIPRYRLYSLLESSRRSARSQERCWRVTTRRTEAHS